MDLGGLQTDAHLHSASRYHSGRTSANGAEDLKDQLNAPKIRDGYCPHQAERAKPMEKASASDSPMGEAFLWLGRHLVPWKALRKFLTQHVMTPKPVERCLKMCWNMWRNPHLWEHNSIWKSLAGWAISRRQHVLHRVHRVARKLLLWKSWQTSNHLQHPSDQRHAHRKITKQRRPRRSWNCSQEWQALPKRCAKQEE